MDGFRLLGRNMDPRPNEELVYACELLPLHERQIEASVSFLRILPRGRNGGTLSGTRFSGEN